MIYHRLGAVNITITRWLGAPGSRPFLGR